MSYFLRGETVSENVTLWRACVKRKELKIAFSLTPRYRSVMTEVTKEQVIEALKTVEDPELFLDIWFLGLVYNIDIEESKVIIEMTFTSPMCPAGPQLIGEVEQKLKLLPGVSDVEVQIVFNPPWEPSEDVKLTLGLM
jgi:metal-sulfur cluster biosynthetic enzyme